MKKVKLFTVFFFLWFSVFGHSETVGSTIIDLEESAEEGDEEAQFLLGLILWKGEEIYQNEGLNWLRKQAEYNNEKTQKYWRTLIPRIPSSEEISRNEKGYRSGETMGLFRPISSFLERAREKKNRQIGLEWLRISAENDYVPAQFEWWRIHNGDKNQSKWKTLILLNVLAENHYAPAEFELYRMLREENIREALNRLRVSAENHYAPAEFEMYLVLKKREELEKERNGEGADQLKMRRLRIAALKWLRKAVKQEHREALFRWGVILRDGTDGVKQSAERAFDAFMRAAFQGHPEAQHNVARMLRFGIGVKENKPESLKWSQKAVAQDFPPAIYDMGMMHLEGLIVARNEKRALKLIWKAAYLGDLDAKYQIGVMYSEGIVVEKDSVEATWWFREAGTQGHHIFQEKARELVSQSDLCHETFSMRVDVNSRPLVPR